MKHNEQFTSAKSEKIEIVEKPTLTEEIRDVRQQYLSDAAPEIPVDHILRDRGYVNTFSHIF